ncbi:VOC family protein [Prosthecobacter sp. SYSU 5D2]|uniref:VOC family protein n=1 Tax=Prosthecobacter sp. SYSU 5D2 TaxID=3134134 RepID=UPI0031FF33A8
MKTSIVEPYLFFSGRCEEALEYYRTTLGAEIGMVMRFDEAPDPPPADMLAPGFEKKIMHSSFHIGSSMIMASDGCGEPESFSGFTLSLSLQTEEEARSTFDALAAEGQVTMPIGKTFWSPCFGMVKDKFGIGWMVTTIEESPTA